MKQFPQSFLDKLNSVTNKRPATVIQHILKHGYITTEELKDKVLADVPIGTAVVYITEK